MSKVLEELASLGLMGISLTEEYTHRPSTIVESIVDAAQDVQFAAQQHQASSANLSESLGVFVSLLREAMDDDDEDEEDEEDDEDDKKSFKKKKDEEEDDDDD